MLSRIKISFSELRQAIMTVNDEILTEHIISQLLQYIPTPDEYDQLSEYADNPSVLDRPEQFLLEMLNIPRYEQRLNALQFRRKFKERADDLRPGMLSLLNASQEVKTSAKLGQLLQVLYQKSFQLI